MMNIWRQNVSLHDEEPPETEMVHDDDSKAVTVEQPLDRSPAAGHFWGAPDLECSLMSLRELYLEEISFYYLYLMALLRR